MSGLLLRLAARASGQRNTTLHSPASLPFHSVVERAESPEPGVDGPDEPPDRSRATEQPVIRMETPTATEQPGAEPSRATAPRPLITPQPDDPGATHHRTTAAPLPNSPTSVATAATAMAPSAPLDTPLPPPLVVPGALMVRAQAPERPAPHRPGLFTTSPTAGPQPSAVAAPGVPTSPGQQADEVHIHIGRIEITAVQESTPGKREPRKGRSPLSLEDYLARRRGEGR